MRERVPLSYAFNRAKKLHQSEGKKIVLDHIKSGAIRIRAEYKEVFNSSHCYRFPINEGELRQKQQPYKVPGQGEIEAIIQQIGDGESNLKEVAKHRDALRRLIEAYQEELGAQGVLDQLAHRIAYGGEEEGEDSEGGKFFVFREASQIILWVDISIADEPPNSTLDIAPRNNFDDEADIKDYIADIDFDPDFNQIEVLRIQILPERRHARYSRYRYEDTLILTKARGLTCLKTDVEELFPHAKEHRSERPPGRQPAFSDKEWQKLCAYLDEKFGGVTGKILNKDVINEIEAFLNDPEARMSKSTLSKYASKYLKEHKEKSTN